MTKTLQSRISLIALLVILGIELFPILWVVSTSFKLPVDITTSPPKVLFTPTLYNYRTLIPVGLLTGLKNSIIVTSGTIILTFILGSPFAYLLARHKFRAKENVRFWILSLRIMPPVAVIIPLVYLWSRLGLFDTFGSLTATYLIFALPLYIWLGTECFRTLAPEVEEAASLEGCSSLQVFYKISLPIALPGLISVLIFAFVMVWNEFYFAFALTSQLQTMPLVVSATAFGQYIVPWGTVSAFTTILIIPPIALIIFFSKSLAKYFIVAA